MSSVKTTVGDLDKVQQVVKLLVMVNAPPDFERHFGVGNGASGLLMELYGDRGRHARSAVEMARLPLQACVEVEMIAEVGD